MRGYAGVSAEERSAQRRAALLDAALDVIAEAGPEALTVRGVCRRARLNDRYFYEHFASRDELIGALYDEIVERQYVPALTERFAAAGDDLVARARAAGEVSVALLERDSRYKRVVAHIMETPALRARRDQIIRLVAGVIQAGAAEFLGEQGTRFELRSIALAAGIFEVVHRWARGELDVSADGIAEFIPTALLAAAGTAPTQRRHRGQHPQPAGLATWEPADWSAAVAPD